MSQTKIVILALMTLFLIAVAAKSGAAENIWIGAVVIGFLGVGMLSFALWRHELLEAHEIKAEDFYVFVAGVILYGGGLWGVGLSESTEKVKSDLDKVISMYPQAKFAGDLPNEKKDIIRKWQFRTDDLPAKVLEFYTSPKNIGKWKVLKGVAGKWKEKREGEILLRRGKAERLLIKVKREFHSYTKCYFTHYKGGKDWRLRGEVAKIITSFPKTVIVDTLPTKEGGVVKKWIVKTPDSIHNLKTFYIQKKNLGDWKVDKIGQNFVHLKRSGQILTVEVKRDQWGCAVFTLLGTPKDEKGK